MAVGDIWRISLEGFVHGHQTVNVFHYRESVAASISGDTPEVLKNGFITIMGDVILEQQSSAHSQRRISVQRVFPLPVAARFDFDMATPGQIATPPVPDTVALVVRRRGPLAGRKNQGRIYVPSIPIANYDETNGRWDAASAAGFQSIADAQDETLEVIGNDGQWEQVLYNRVTRLHQRQPGIVRPGSPNPASA